MSSAASSSSSKLSQFGLYRAIDARTEEFLRLSRRRQIRQGCACAAVSTAITVTVVIVILLIYEYGIAVDWSLVQINKTNRSNLAEDKPVADRLDRSYFGFDQDYFEKMPLLVNAMQENSNIEPTIDTTSVKARARYIITNYSRPTSTTMLHRSSSIRRTSPRPFYFEYKSPTPTPFSKTYGSRSWVENYRNTQRLKNLQQVINYLEKTINAKFGDLYALPTSTIAFSGLYVEPVSKDNNQPKSTLPTADMISESSNKLETHRSNHKSDPLYNFKPDSPGDVNLLADGFFRFSPVPTPSLLKEKLAASIPMFRPIGTRKKKCIGHRCAESGESKIVSSRELTDFLGPEAPSYDKPKSFSVMLNVVPLKPTNLDSFDSTQVPIPTSKIYITTPRPIIQFRRKSTTPVRLITTTRFKNPRFLPTRKYMKAIHVRSEEKRDIEPKIIVHMNVYPSSEVKDQVAAESTTLTSTSTSSTTQSNAPRYSTEIPMLTSTQVEDYHVGSSGIIPVEARLTPAPPPPIPPEYMQSTTTTTTMTPPTPIPFFDITTSSTEANYRTTIKSLGPTNPPEILKFSHEDAKIPDQYKRLMNIEETTKQIEMSRRNSQDGVEISDDYEDNPRTRTLLVKLRNKAEIISETTATTSKEINYDTTTVKTYVPQINGHYRSVNQNSKTINTWINESSETPESKRKRRLEMSVTGFRKSTYVPQYVEIKRNYTRNLSDEDKEE